MCRDLIALNIPKDLNSDYVYVINLDRPTKHSPPHSKLTNLSSKVR